MSVRSWRGWTLACALAVVILVFPWDRTFHLFRTKEVQRGDFVLPLDVNTIFRIEIAQGTNRTVLTRLNGFWKVDSLFGHEALFVKVVEALGRLSQVDVGQVLPADESQLPEYGLASSPGQARDVAFPMTPSPYFLTLSAASGADPVRLTLGDRRCASSRTPGGESFGGQYLRVNNGPVLLVARPVYGFSARGIDWIETRLGPIPEDEVVWVETEVSNITTRLTVQGEGFQQEPLLAGEQWDDVAARRAFGAMKYLQALDVADPALPDSVTGMSLPDRYRFLTRDGQRVEVLLGGKTPDGSGSYVRLSVHYVRPEPLDEEKAFRNALGKIESDEDKKTIQARIENLRPFWEADSRAVESKAKQSHARMAPHLYVVDPSIVEVMRQGRDRLVISPSQEMRNMRNPEAK